MPWSDYLVGKVQDWLHGGGAYTPPATTYFAVMTTAPHSDGTSGVEASITRVAFANDATNWAAYTLGAGKVNAVVIDFGIVSSAVVVADIAEYDAFAGGHLLTFGTSGALSVLAGQRLVVAVGDAVLQTA